MNISNIFDTNWGGSLKNELSNLSSMIFGKVRKFRTLPKNSYLTKKFILYWNIRTWRKISNTRCVGAIYLRNWTSNWKNDCDCDWQSSLKLRLRLWFSITFWVWLRLGLTITFSTIFTLFMGMLNFFSSSHYIIGMAWNSFLEFSWSHKYCCIENLLGACKQIFPSHNFIRPRLLITIRLCLPDHGYTTGLKKKMTRVVHALIVLCWSFAVKLICLR